MMKKFAASILAVLMIATMAPNALAATVVDKSPPVSSGTVDDISPPLTTSASGDYTVEKSPLLTTSASEDYTVEKSPTVVPNAAAKNNSAKIPPAGLEERVLKWRAYNRDTIGWLNIPDTKINNPVMWYPDDNNAFYLRRNEKKESDFNGCYFADYRCDYKNYTLPQYTTIYGHSMSDDPKDARFSQLRKFLDDSFAKSHPYIYFSDGNKTYTFRVFAVYTTTVDTPYNVPNLDEETRKKVIDEAVELSVRDYGYKPGKDEKILTLSTATYSLTDGTPLYFPNRSRFVVMAYAVKNPNQPASLANQGVYAIPSAEASAQASKALNDGYVRLADAVSKFMAEQYKDCEVLNVEANGNSRYSSITVKLKSGLDDKKIGEISNKLANKFGSEGSREYVNSYVDVIEITSGKNGIGLVID